ncbi:membrane protein [Mycobacterium gastri 'Wayne']|nr:membrane protein [Mycobacterium gastri 'Wayne']
MALLAVDGVLSALAGALLLPSYIGSVPFPISAVISGLVNAALVWAAARWTTSPRVAALPLWTWLVTVAVLSLGGPGDDIVLGGQGLMAYGALILIGVGVAPPAWVLWRRRIHP